MENSDCEKLLRVKLDWKLNLADHISDVCKLGVIHKVRRRGVVVIITAQLHSTKPELRFCAGSNSARGVSEIRDGEDP